MKSNAQGSFAALLQKLRWKYHWCRKSVDINYPPVFLNVEPTNACNLNCQICALDDSRKKGRMPWPLFEKIIDQAAGAGVSEIRLFLAGEPLIDTRLGQMVSRVREKGMISCVHTNATLLTEERSRELIENGLDIVSFSFHGDTAQAYNDVHVGAEFDTTLQNILRFLAIKKELKSPRPYTVLQMARVPDAGGRIPRVIPEFRQRFDGLPLDRLRVVPAHAWAGQSPDIELEPNRDYYFPCQAPWQSLSIGWDGRVFGCCGDLNGVMQLGDVREHTVEEIWASEPVVGLRKKMVDGELDDLPLCRQCDALWRRAHPFFGDLKRTLLG